MEASDYTVPIYLNQAVVFDLLAIMEDGMAQISTIRTSEARKGAAEGGIGTSNVFALLGIGLKGSSETQEGRETTSERVHTPTSLFAKVRSHLRKEKLVHELTKREASLGELRPGQFVEVEVRLRRNPLVDALEAVNETISGLKVISSFAPADQKTAAQKTQAAQMSDVADKTKRLLAALTKGGSGDLVGEIVPGPVRAVVRVEERYFGEHSAEEIVDGHYRVFGKVVSVLPKEGESISLLRNTPFAHLPPMFFAPLGAGFAATKSAGLSLPEFKTTVDGPVIQLMPVAIFL
jgi:hypothetical protein